MAIEEHQVRRRGADWQIIHPEELHHCRSWPARDLRVELADAHQTCR